MNDERRIAYLTLMDVEQNKAYSNLALNHHIAVGRPNSEALVRRLVYGVLENKMYLDFVIGKYLNQPMRKLNFSESNILRLGIYQLAFMNSIPTYAAVAETVNLAKKYIRGREGFINAILRNYLRSGHEIRLPDRNKDESEFLSIKYSYAKWIVDMWIKEYGSAFTEELLAAGNKAPQLTIRPNTLRINKKNLKKRLIENGFEVENGRISNIALRVKGEGLLKTGLYENGMFSVQDESSMVAVDILNPGPGENAIDVCAAPGGKTMFIAERMENMGNVVARDLYKKKIDLLIKEADRLGITIISGGTWDAM
ncbi:MAG TPA: transcription antitermination factor NusB, partial [Anaerovoracaceae bacterium]|nr:transcription antitermination factor NusB [Anaerovoracaceae bacterium]